MPDVIVVCVSDDLPQAEALAEMFDVAGFSVSDDVFNDRSLARASAVVLVLSPAALRSEHFLNAAQRALDAGIAVIASLEHAARSSFGAAPVFDLSNWYGEPQSATLDRLFFSVDRMRTTVRVRPREHHAPRDERAIAAIAAE